MRIEWKAVTRRIELGEYAAEMSAGHIDVRVNVSRETMRRMLSVSTETPREEFFGLLVELWNPLTPSPSPEGRGEEEWPVEDVRALYEHCRENDPQLWIWLTDRTWSLVMEYQGLKKKE